jgi:hypothetical protein
MTPEELRRLLDDVATGTVAAGDAVERLRAFPTDHLGFARVDTQRTLRTGIPEVIYGAGKTAAQVAEIAERLAASGAPVLATRVKAEMADAVRARVANVQYHDTARMLTAPGREDLKRHGRVTVVSAGTSDQPVAEEAAITADALGAIVERVYDAGVAAIHRILAERPALDRADAVVVVAGMEGALPSVVGGLTDRPIIGVPTSVGYGAAFGGLAALLGMLTSCAPGVSVVNIDNGFGAGVQATLIARRVAPESE